MSDRPTRDASYAAQFLPCDNRYYYERGGVMVAMQIKASAHFYRRQIHTYTTRTRATHVQLANTRYIEIQRNRILRGWRTKSGTIFLLGIPAFDIVSYVTAMTLFSCATRVTYVWHARCFEIEAIRPPQAPDLFHFSSSFRKNMGNKFICFFILNGFYNNSRGFSLFSSPNEREKLSIIISSRRNDAPGRMSGVGGWIGLK